MEYQKRSLNEALQASKIEMKKLLAERLSNDDPAGVGANVFLDSKIQRCSDGLDVGMTVRIESTIANISATANCVLPLQEGWEIQQGVLASFLSDDCLPTLYAQLRETIYLLNYQIGLPRLEISHQLDEQQRTQLSKASIRGSTDPCEDIGEESQDLPGNE